MKSKNIYTEILKDRQKILEAFIAETGLKPSECEQVVTRTENEIKWYVQKRTLPV